MNRFAALRARFRRTTDAWYGIDAWSITADSASVRPFQFGYTDRFGERSKESSERVASFRKSLNVGCAIIEARIAMP
jgi:hypothetical protein